MSAAIRSRRGRLLPASVLCGLSLPALLWAAPADKPAAANLRPARVLAPRVADSLLGITLGMDLDDVHAKLKALGAPAGDADKDRDKDKDADQDKDGGDKGKGAAKPAGADEDDDEGHQEAWTLRGTPYAHVAFATDDRGKVLWVTGFVRPGHEIPFASLGDLSQAVGRSDNRVLWNVIRPRHLYRVTAAGKGGKAGVVSLISLRPTDPVGIFSPQVLPKSMQGKPK